MPHPNIQGNCIGKNLRKARKAAHLTQLQLSAALSIEYGIELSEPLISKIESGERTVRDKELVALCRILNVSPNVLLDW